MPKRGVPHDAQPKFTLNEFASRVGRSSFEIATIMARCPVHPEAASSLISRTTRYPLGDLAKWWKSRPISCGEFAKSLGTTKYLVQKAVRDSNLVPVIEIPTTQTKSGEGVLRLYSREALAAAWAGKAEGVTA
jgi:hypothetical protein